MKFFVDTADTAEIRDMAARKHSPPPDSAQPSDTTAQLLPKEKSWGDDIEQSDSHFRIFDKIVLFLCVAKC